MGARVDALHENRAVPGGKGQMSRVLEISPKSNLGMASAMERGDSTQALATALMGLQHPVQIVSEASEVHDYYEWDKPPRLTRAWHAAVPDDNPDQLDWQIQTLGKTLDGIGLRTTVRQHEPAFDAFHITPDCVMDAHGYYCSTLVLRRWPREVSPGWLGQALSSDQVPVTAAFHVRPDDPARIARYLKHQQIVLDDGGKDAANELGRRDAEDTRKKLIAYQDRPVKVAVAFTVRAKDKALLKQRVATFGHEIGLRLADVRLAKFEQDLGLETTSLGGRMRLRGAWRTLVCTSVASTWPFMPATIRHANGADLGVTNVGGMLFKLDPFDESLRSFSALVTGSVGSGKSFILKLLLMGLKGVEKIVVEHSDPPEYAGIPCVQTYSLADMNEAEQAAKLREFVTNLWETAKRDKRPRLLILDELWSLIRRPELAGIVEEIARRGRKFFLSLLIATQQIEELLESAKAVFDNAAIKVFLQQENRDISGLAKAAKLSTDARRFLRAAARGQALFDVNGMLIPVDIQANPAQYKVANTDPREEYRNGLGHQNSEDQPDWSRLARLGLVSAGSAGSGGVLMADAQR
jgi:hypothetical protein